MNASAHEVHNGSRTKRDFFTGDLDAIGGRPIVLGVYAAHPPLEPGFLGSKDEIEFYERVWELPGVGGIELPFTGELHPKGVAWLADRLAVDATVVVTALPGQMQSMAGDPLFGLASSDAEGRERAVRFVVRLANQLEELYSSRPDLALTAVEVHGGPRPSTDGRAPSRDALARSVEELSKLPILNGLLHLEHCDSYRSALGAEGTGSSHEVPYAKGFLPFSDVVEVARDTGARVVVNWGRSAIDGRSIETPLEHVERAVSEGILGGLMFSGASLAHPLYGSTTEDSHAPFAEAWQGGDAEKLALTESRASECIEVARDPWLSGEVFVGLKVQPLPKTLGAADRLAFLERNLASLLRSLSGVTAKKI